MFLRIFIAGVFCLFCFISKAQLDATGKIKAELQKAEKDPGFATAFIGFCLMDAQTGEVLVETNSQKSFITASAMKPVTIGAALALLGDTFRFKTEMGYEGEIKNGVLDGNIIFTGNGDPTIGSERWDTTNIDTIANIFFKALKAKGINEIRGNISVKPKFYTQNLVHSNIPPGYNVEDIYYPYGAWPEEINIFENKVNTSTIVYVIPSLENPVLKDKYYFIADDDTAKIEKLNSELPYTAIDSIFKQEYVDDNWGVSTDMIEPANIFSLFIKYNFKKKQLAVGERRMGLIENFVLPQKIEIYQSPTLLDISTKANQESLNLYAESIMRAIGIKQYGSTTLDSSLAITQRFWKETVGDTKGLRMTDGSGMSRSNLCTPLLFCKMFSAYSKRPNFQSFYSTFAVAGQSGTVKNFGKGTKAEGNARIKTGTMSRVKTFVGYVKGANGKLYSFALMINNFEPDSKPTELARKIIPLIAEIK